MASPEGYQLEPGIAALDTTDPREAVDGADAVYTDVWVSIGDETEAEQRRAELAAYRVDADLLSHAADRAIVLHCLPAHRARRSPRTCCTAIALSSSTRPRTASTPRRRCWSCSSIPHLDCAEAPWCNG